MDIQAAVASFNAQKTALIEGLRANFAQMMKSRVFELHPKLTSVSWVQYTPYFNDGSECVFGVRQDGLDLVFDGEEFEDVSDWTFKPTSSEYHQREQNAVGLAAAHAAVAALLGEIPEEFYKELFGDHVRVMVTPDGATTDEYEHD